ncbi:hypothetical protein CABS01_14280 [Colletotrichum abscissum]|uniref:uncharacterized protein n=1 Tax=Colletotrichum abscissum TaxID=1671311 RepID=UPI0027D5AB83|nr:uncharacterized protein CABS01_14280 [Colletotrichum abscissum]KAK1481192.1 hypothetical protein CABS01_14280 [Colletotrichum abscissum]
MSLWQVCSLQVSSLLLPVVSCKLVKCFQLEEGTKRGPCMYWVHACLPVQMIPTYLRYRTYAKSLCICPMSLRPGIR